MARSRQHLAECELCGRGTGRARAGACRCSAELRRRRRRRESVAGRRAATALLDRLLRQVAAERRTHGGGGWSAVAAAAVLVRRRPRRSPCWPPRTAAAGPPAATPDLVTDRHRRRNPATGGVGGAWASPTRAGARAVDLRLSGVQRPADLQPDRGRPGRQPADGRHLVGAGTGYGTAAQPEPLTVHGAAGPAPAGHQPLRRPHRRRAAPAGQRPPYAAGPRRAGCGAASGTARIAETGPTADRTAAATGAARLSTLSAACRCGVGGPRHGGGHDDATD